MGAWARSTPWTSAVLRIKALETFFVAVLLHPMRAKAPFTERPCLRVHHCWAFEVLVAFVTHQPSALKRTCKASPDIQGSL